MKYYVHLS